MRNNSYHLIQKYIANLRTYLLKRKTKMKNIFIILFSYIYIIQVFSASLPIDLSENELKNTEFAIKLPNNDTVSIQLNFKLLKYSNDLNKNIELTTKAENKSNEEQEDSPPPINQSFTVEQAIETFRQDLVKKEKNIAGIIESSTPFYRHFQLQYKDNIKLRIRCTYDSNYLKRRLNISCFEYRQVEYERILSNGEIEAVSEDDTTYRSDITLINIQDYTHDLDMEIL